jgi:hypothetical protein
LVVTTAARPAWAGVYYEAEENRQGPRGKVGLVIKRTCYVSGAKARIENATPFGSDVVILRFDTGMRYNLRPRHKDCMSQELPKPDPRVRVTVTKTEETKKIGPYTCTRCDASVDGRTETHPCGPESIDTEKCMW